MQDRGTRTKEVLITALYAADSDAELKRKLPVDVEDVWASRSWAPTEQVFRSVKTALEYTHGVIPHKPSDHSVVDSLVGTILSQNTTDVNSSRCFQLLKQRFSDWEELLDADDDDVAETIKSGGLSKIKTKRIKDIFREIKGRNGEICLEHLRNESTEKIKEQLSAFKGVGPKTISCVLLFTLKRNDFPVDTHVNRLSQRLGWTPNSATREETYEFLNSRVPDDIKYDLHLLLIQHGKITCQSQKADCKACDAKAFCKTGVKYLPKHAQLEQKALNESESSLEFPAEGPVQNVAT
mmetsp:Transcript_15969/g.65676  ORF Transcript_15969/g.65676 Transcript_15969/m.65676 type:complete len:295 (-) Transcript_15969:124-1008(-)